MKKLFTNNPAETIILLLIVILVIVGIALGILSLPIEPESGLQLMTLLPLLPCPFCGGKAWLKSRGCYAWVICEGCGLETKKYNAPGADETVFNLWNTRPKQLKDSAWAQKVNARNGHFHPHAPTLTGKVSTG